MTMEPSQEYVKQELQLADEALSDAKYLLRDDRLKAAANRACYAMFYAVRAALTHARAKRTKTHGGALSLFGKHYVASGLVEPGLARRLQDAYELRQQADYVADAVVMEDDVKEMIEGAQAFVAEVRGVIDS